jgi:trehalose 6-phosphate phosphatase
VSTLDATLAALAADPGRTALLLDFDGSLSKIVLRPDDAVPLPGTADVLDDIAEHLAIVGIVSGRPVEYLHRVLATRRVALVGQYGLERWHGDDVVVDERVLPYVDAVGAAAEEAERRWPDLLIERKGEVAVGIHWRTNGAVDPRVVDGIDALAAKVGLAVHPSRMARELRPPLGVDKGTAVEQLAAGMRTAAFAGDDAGDLPAFSALERMQREHGLEHAIRIAVASSEAPAAVLEASDITVEGPEGLRALLDRLRARLR